MNPERHPRICLMISRPSVHESAENVLRNHGCDVQDSYDEILRCDLLLFDAFFAHAGLKKTIAEKSWSSPSVLVAAPDEIGACGPSDDIVILRSYHRRDLERTFQLWIEDFLRVAALNPAKPAGHVWRAGLTALELT